MLAGDVNAVVCDTGKGAFRCGVGNVGLWLHAHHINADPANPVPELQALCPSCHWQCKQSEARVRLERLKHQQLLANL